MTHVFHSSEKPGNYGYKYNIEQQIRTRCPKTDTLFFCYLTKNQVHTFLAWILPATQQRNKKV